MEKARKYVTSSNILGPVLSDDMSDIRFLAAEVSPVNNFQIHAHFPISGDIYYTNCQTEAVKMNIAYEMIIAMRK